MELLKPGMSRKEAFAALEKEIDDIGPNPIEDSIRVAIAPLLHRIDELEKRVADLEGKQER